MEKQIKGTMNYLYDHVKAVNDSKIFAGLVILTLNLSSKLMTLPMSKTVEVLIKNHFSQYVLVFAISWMGTREVFVALFVTFLFAICMEFLFNEQSSFCCLSEGFVSSTIQNAEEDEELTTEELEETIKTIEKVKTLLTKNKLIKM